MERIPKRVLYVPIIIFIALLAYVVIERWSIVEEFPFDGVNDLSSYMGNLHFLQEYGYHEAIPNWYNGQYVLFLFYPPMWYFFTYPILMIVGKVELATMISILLIYLFAAFFSLRFSKRHGLSKVEGWALFAFIFANPFAISNFIRLGRPHELLAWLLVLIMFHIILQYRNKHLDMKFFWIVIPYSLLLLSHEGVFLLGSLLFLSLLIVRDNIDRIKILFAGIMTAAITSFWWVPFIINLGSSDILGSVYELARRLVILNRLYLIENITSFVIGGAFLALFYLYWKTRTDEKVLPFYLPQLVIGIIFFTRLIAFIPFLNRIYPDIYNMFLLIHAVYFLFKIDFNKLPAMVRKMTSLALVLIPIAAVIIFIMFIPKSVPHTVQDRETVELFRDVDGRLLILNGESLEQAYYSYGAIYHNISTSYGWSDPSIADSYLRHPRSMETLLKNSECSNFLSELTFLNTTNVISYDEHCATLEKCGLKPVDVKSSACLYKTP